MTRAYRCTTCQHVAAYGDLDTLSDHARATLERHHDAQVRDGSWTEIDGFAFDPTMDLCIGHGVAS